MPSIIKLKSDLAFLKKAGLALLLFLIMIVIFANPLDENTQPPLQILFWLMLAGAILFLWLYFVCKQAIDKLSRVRRNYLDLLEAHNHFMSLATDEQLLESLVYTPESILFNQVQKLNRSRKEGLIRKASARLKQIKDWLEAHPEQNLKDTTSEEEQLWLDFKHQLAGLEELLNALKK